LTIRRTTFGHGAWLTKTHLLQRRNAPPINAKRSWRRVRSALLVILACLAMWPSAGLPQTSTIRVGHFPNVTHVQGLVAHHLTRRGRGWFEQRLRSRLARLTKAPARRQHQQPGCTRVN
jgi:hypothetical protein